MKIVYLFDEITREYKGEYEAQRSPLEPDVYIEPVHSTSLQPLPFEQGKYNYFDGSQWTLKDDTRGVRFKPDHTAVEVENLTDVIDATWSRTDPPKTQAELNAESNSLLLSQIAQLEAQQARPMREIALGDTTYALPKLQAINDQIAVLRAQLL